jgi:predicted MFS family arabinose efflux permease
MQLPNALRSFRNRNLRLFFAGQAVSLVGTWAQSVAQGWLVWRLTGSKELLGLVGFLSQVPVTFFGAFAGSLADRFPRRRLVLITQANAVAQAALLAAVTLAGVVRPWHVLVLAAMLGMTYAFEIPARQALLADVAGEDMSNAIALNSSIVNGARAIGPALAGWLVATVGEGYCFAFNALSFGGTIYALWVMKVPPQPAPVKQGTGARLAEGFRWAWNTPHIRAILALLAVSSLLAIPYATLLPAVAAEVLGGGAGLFGILQALAGVGAFLGAVSLLGRRGLKGLARRIGVGASCLGAGVITLGLSRSVALSAFALLLAGAGMISQMAGTMTLLQGLTTREMRGRVIGLFSTLFVGVAPFGALGAGAVAGRIGVPATLVIGGGLVVVASIAFHVALPSLRVALRKAHPEVADAGIP